MPTGIPKAGFRKSPINRKQVECDPMSPYRRIWDRDHYKKKGLPFDVYLTFCKQNCHYCGAAPTRVNAICSTFKGDTYSKTRKGKRYSYYAWEQAWVEVNGIDKKTPTDNYHDVDNLVTCCIVCNWMKNTMGHDEFIAHCKKIAVFKS